MWHPGREDPVEKMIWRCRREERAREVFGQTGQALEPLYGAGLGGGRPGG